MAILGKGAPAYATAAYTGKQPARIDVARHGDGFRDAATRVSALVARLREGKAWLLSHPLDDPDREGAEDLWRDLNIQLISALRDAYARFALLRIALPHETAMDLWDAVMPSAPDMEDVGIEQIMMYWRRRTDPPSWITREEMSRITNAWWPPRKDVDVFQDGLETRYLPPPF